MSGENEPSPSGESIYVQDETVRGGKGMGGKEDRGGVRGREPSVYTKIIFGLVHANS